MNSFTLKFKVDLAKGKTTQVKIMILPTHNKRNECNPEVRMPTWRIEMNL